MNRNYLIIGVVAIIVIAAGIWLFLFKGPAGPSGIPGINGSLPLVNGGVGGGSVGVGPRNGASSGSAGTSGSLPTQAATPAGISSGATKFGLISNEPAADYFIDKSNNVTVVGPTGKIATILNGDPSFLSSTEIPDLISARFSYSGVKVLANFGDPSNPQTSIFDITTKAWSPLPVGIISPVWSPSDSRIAYLKTNSDGSVSLTTLDASKASSKPVTLLTLAAQDLTLAWPNKNTIILAEKASGYIEGSVLTYDIPSQTIARPLSGLFGLSTLWSNTTTSVPIAFSNTISGRNPKLSYYPASGSPQDISLLTLPSKCAFNYEFEAAQTSPASAVSSTTTSTAQKQTKASPPVGYLALYCAVPQDQNVFSSAHLPDNYNQMSLFTIDLFEKVRMDTGDATIVYLPAASLDATNLKVVNNTLFFVNRYDSKLYAISLAQ